jgi:hypothetical protein
MKRRFEEIAEVGEGEDFRFQFLDGSPVPGEAMFTTFTQQLILIITRGFTAERVRLLEQSSKIARDWVRKHNIWTQLFARDYPDAFTIHFDQNNRGMAQMSSYAATQLQLMSPQGRGPRVYTLWKRYYELMSKAPIGKVEMVMFGRTHRGITIVPSQRKLPHPLHPDIPSGNPTLYLANPTRGDTTIGYWVNNYIVLDMTNPPEDVQYAAKERNMDIDTYLLETSQMEKVSIDRRNKTGIKELVPYDKSKLGRRINIYVNMTSFFLSNDGFDVLDEDGLFRYITWYPVSRTLTRPLVSNCYVCGSIESRLCLGCSAVSYCGTACQAEDWKSGHSEKCLKNN